jgi:hypothetical protein
MTGITYRAVMLVGPENAIEVNTFGHPIMHLGVTP